MRRATHDVQWIKDENGQLLGLSLGYDFCAEHEFGVKRMKQDLGISGGEGIEGRTMTQQPRLASYFEYERTRKKKRGTRKAPPKDPAAVFIVGGYCGDHSAERTMAERISYVCRDGLDFYAEEHDNWYDPNRDQLAVAWDENGFAIHVRGKENIENLTQLREHMANMDMALADPSGMGWVDRAGLALVIASRVDPKARAEILAQDRAHKKLMDAAEATGIEEELKAAGKRYYALSPAWKDSSETELTFYLNPSEQQKYNYGWYNLEQLRQWARDEGPILKQEETQIRKPKP